jgi:L-arabinonolactonase
MAKPKAECVLDAKARVGEGAIWSMSEQALYWVDIPQGLLQRFDPATGQNQSWQMNEPAGCFALCQSGRIAVALSSGFWEFDPGTGKKIRISGPEPGKRGHRFNDGTVDQAGRFLAGTMPLAGASAQDSSGTLYSLDSDLVLREVMAGFHVINGLAFSPDGRTAYVSDSFPPIRTIWAFDYDPDDGAWTGKRVFFDTKAVAGRPDGGAMDAQGCYWMAGVGGWQLVRITPEGRVDMQIPMPVEKPTRIAFGGRDLDTLFVTSISTGLSKGSRQPQAGGLFALRVPGVTGLPFPLMKR